MRVLVACECSGVVRRAFRMFGHEAYSCDLQASDDNSPFHFQQDIFEVLDKKWDLMIAHPPCTYLTISGNKWFKSEFKERFPTRLQDREKGLQFFIDLYNSNINKICLENPVGIVSTRFKKPTQIIEPYQFGHPITKKTCLWLKNLAPLKPTIIVEPEFVTFKSGKRMSKFHAETSKLKGEARQKARSKTFEGIALAMAKQWGEK